jgi:DNA-binding NarL/FixJ family response regulator
MPTMTWVQATRELSDRNPHLPILMLSIYDNEQYVFEALKAGASSYALKSVADQDLLNACHAAMRGELFIDHSVMSALMRSHLDWLRRGEPSPTNVLTARKDQVRQFIAEGHRREPSPTC